ncbi:hypothetical protein BB934_29135 (plasmid) [Microvirga ossetica]|uniref:Uncharacterized protein n=1 Tax=Microvirga ossetica TaxID=1882682 RepID=A0A1B2EQV9_9HYPH|nr:hypothetical protein [Microvirga ossetica]ANY82374.1 hypothetical protein BB934_29135 [Microvirga ossetica]
MFLIFYRSAYVALALYIAVSEYQMDGGLFDVIAYPLMIALALEALYWLQRLQTSTPRIVLGWMKAREDRKRQQKAATE